MLLFSSESVFFFLLSLVKMWFFFCTVLTLLQIVGYKLISLKEAVVIYLSLLFGSLALKGNEPI